MRAVRLKNELLKFKDEHKLTNKDIADLASISDSVVSRILRGSSNPSKKTISRLEKVLELSENDIETKVKKEDKQKEQTEYREVTGVDGKKYLLIKRKNEEVIVEL